MVSAKDINDDRVDAAIDFVIDNAAIDRATPVSYSRVFSAAGLPPPQDLHHGGDGQVVTLLMERFHQRCVARGLPPLDALVVHVTGTRVGHPGAGYFRVNGYKDPFGEKAKAEDVVKGHQFWVTQQQECRVWGDRRRRGQV